MDKSLQPKLPLELLSGFQDLFHFRLYSPGNEHVYVCQLRLSSRMSERPVLVSGEPIEGRISLSSSMEFKMDMIHRVRFDCMAMVNIITGIEFHSQFHSQPRHEDDEWGCGRRCVFELVKLQTNFEVNLSHSFIHSFIYHVDPEDTLDDYHPNTFTPHPLKSLILLTF